MNRPILTPTYKLPKCFEYQTIDNAKPVRKMRLKQKINSGRLRIVPFPSSKSLGKQEDVETAHFGKPSQR